MDLDTYHDLIYGEEFCFSATISNPSLHTPTGVSVPYECYDDQTFWGHNDQGLHSRVDATPCMGYIVPGYMISPHGPDALHPRPMANGQFIRAQEHLLDTVDHSYSQQGHTPQYVVLPFMADRTPAIPSQTVAYSSDSPWPCELYQTACVASERGIAWDSPLQSSTHFSNEFHGDSVASVAQLHGPAPGQQQLAGRTMVPAKLHHAQQYLQLEVPSVSSSLHTDFLNNNHASNVGCKMMTEDRSQSCSKPSSHANQGMSIVSWKKKGKAKKPVRSMPSEITVKSYTSRLDIGNQEGSIVIRTDEYNREDFQLIYPNAKFFVIKPINEADVHKSIKYGVWSTSSVGNEKLDSAFREAQAMAASSCTLCPVLLFFTVTGSSHFCGVAEMIGPVNFQKHMDFWSKDRWIGSFPVKWHIIKDICNSTFRSMMLQNNEDKPVTSKDPEELDYICGTSMLEIFKYTRAEKCLLDKFLMHDEEEARNLQKRRFKLRRGAQHFVRARPLQPKSDSVLMYRPIRERNNLKDQLQDLDLNGHQGLCQDFGKLSSETSPANTLEESKYSGKQAHDSVLEAVTYHAHQARTSSMKPASDGEQNCRKVESNLSGEIHSEIACFLAKTPEDYAIEDKIALAAADTTHEGQMILGKPSPPAVNSESREPQPNHLAGFISVGSMLIPIASSN